MHNGIRQTAKNADFPLTPFAPQIHPRTPKAEVTGSTPVGRANSPTRINVHQRFYAQTVVVNSTAVCVYTGCRTRVENEFSFNTLILQAAPLPDNFHRTSFYVVSQAKGCGLRPAFGWINTLISAGPGNAIAASSAACRSAGSVT